MTAPTAAPAVHQYVDCPDCEYPLDPAALPRHPIHDLTPQELETFERAEDARQAREEAQRWARIRADEARARRAAKHSRRKR